MRSVSPLAYLLRPPGETRRRGPVDVGNGLLVVAIAALVGGRPYHVIDQWEALQGRSHQDHPAALTRASASTAGSSPGHHRAPVRPLQPRPVLRWADIVAPGVFVMQAIARWGNFFNQELYGPPTTLPWGIPIDCAHRVAEYPCARFPEPPARFHPLFLYELLSGVLGALMLFLTATPGPRLRPGDLPLFLHLVRLSCGSRSRPYAPTTGPSSGSRSRRLVSLGFIVPSVAISLIYRHRPKHGVDAPPSRPAEAIWGAVGSGAGDQSVAVRVRSMSRGPMWAR